MSKEELMLEVLKMMVGEKGTTNVINNSPEATKHCMVGKYCVIRTYSAGVHVGTVESVNGTEVILSNSRRIWKWEGAFTLSELSQKGIKDGKLATTLPMLVLTESVEIIPCSEKAEKQIKEFKDYEV